MRDYICPFEGCGKAFFEKGNLKTPLRLHTGEKPYHCKGKGCNRSFATQGHLNDHFQKNHANEDAEEDEKDSKLDEQQSDNQKNNPNLVQGGKQVSVQSSDMSSTLR